VRHRPPNPTLTHLCQWQYLLSHELGQVGTAKLLRTSVCITVGITSITLTSSYSHQVLSLTQICSWLHNSFVLSIWFWHIGCTCTTASVHPRNYTHQCPKDTPIITGVPQLSGYVDITGHACLKDSAPIPSGSSTVGARTIRAPMQRAPASRNPL
jgi:hypothetical protein